MFQKLQLSKLFVTQLYEIKSEEKSTSSGSHPDDDLPLGDALHHLHEGLGHLVEPLHRMLVRLQLVLLGPLREPLPRALPEVVVPVDIEPGDGELLEHDG